MVARGIKIDYIGLSLIVVGLGSLQIVLDQGQPDDWFGSTSIAIFMMLAIVALVALVIHEWNHPHPILELKLLWRMYQMSGLAFIFIPISILSYVGVPRDKSNQVSGISNFIRNLGGSVGISMLTTFFGAPEPSASEQPGCPRDRSQSAVQHYAERISH